MIFSTSFIHLFSGFYALVCNIFPANAMLYIVDVKKMTGKKTLLQNSKLKEGTTVETGDLQVFVLEKLAIATNHFQEINKLGRGGFGTVYKVTP